MTEPANDATAQRAAEPNELTGVAPNLEGKVTNRPTPCGDELPAERQALADPTPRD